MEIGIPWALDTPAGTIEFTHEDGDGIRITGVAGMDGGQIRAPVSSRPQRDGAIVHDFFRGALYPVLTGLLIYRSNADENENLRLRREAEDVLRGYTHSLLRADGTLRWVPSGGAERKVTVRLMDAVMIAHAGVLKEWQLALVAENPTVYAVVGDEIETSPVTPGAETWKFPFSFPFSFGSETTGGECELVQGGTTDSWPLLRMYGPASSPTITNVTTGHQMLFPGLELAAGDYLELDHFNETVLLNGNPDAGAFRYIEPSQSRFFALVPGDNEIRFTGGQVGSAARVVIEWADAFI